jgi:hypothetical protein
MACPPCTGKVHGRDQDIHDRSQERFSSDHRGVGKKIQHLHILQDGGMTSGKSECHIGDAAHMFVRSLCYLTNRAGS